MSLSDAEVLQLAQMLIEPQNVVRKNDWYEPRCWNDEGVYTYFYIDFKRAMEKFSTGMFNESIVIHDSEQIKATGVEYISPGVYKIYADIADRNHGITVVNKKTSLLAFLTGEQLSVFSVHFFVSGIASYARLKYCYDDTSFIYPYTSLGEQNVLIDISSGSIDIEPGYDSISGFPYPYGSINEKTASVILT